MPTPWSQRYGSDRNARADRIEQSLPPFNVPGKTNPQPLWLWSAAQRTMGVPGAQVVKNHIRFKGHVEEPSMAARVAKRRYVRSQRVTETYNPWYSDNVYKVRLANNLTTAVSCTCPDYQNRGGKCKHMLAVEERIQDEEEEEEEGDNNDNDNDNNDNAGDDQTPDADDAAPAQPVRRAAAPPVRRRLVRNTSSPRRLPGEGYTQLSYRPEYSQAGRIKRNARMPSRYRTVIAGSAGWSFISPE